MLCFDYAQDVQFESQDAVAWCVVAYVIEEPIPDCGVRAFLIHKACVDWCEELGGFIGLQCLVYKVDGFIISSYS